MSLFAVGVFAFLWSFWNVVQRSREEQIAVTQVYLLLRTTDPDTGAGAHARAARRADRDRSRHRVRSRTETPTAQPGTSLAVGVLVPMFGIGLNGLWAAYHGTFPPLPEHPAADSARER